jgi:hypothetical protein
MAEATTAARQEVVEARRAVDSELDVFGTSARAAFDIPAKVRAHPVETVGAAGGAAFLLFGGPKRVARAVEQRLFPQRDKRPKTLLPKDVDKTVNRLPADDREQVRAHLERDFAAYLQKTHPNDPPTGRQSFWKTYDTVVGIVGAATARELVKRLFTVPAEARVEQAKEDSKAAAQIQQSGAAAKPK